MLNNKTLLITGGTGSFGKHCVKYLLKKFNLKKIIIFSRDELKQYHMADEIKNINKKTKIRFFIGDVRDRDRLKLAFHEVDFVIHAAALKQIPAAEYNPQECIKTNIYGAENVIFAALEKKIKKVIALSTDKACNPINLYGATKLAADKLFISANTLAGAQNIIFSVVRYGNVINSRGSVIPLFKKIHDRKEKIYPITDKNMTRFFITLDESVSFVLKAFERMKGGEIFIPKLPTIKILDIVKALERKAKIKEIGVRSGEKIHESLGGIDEARNTIGFKDHYVIAPNFETNNISSFLTNKLNEKGELVKSNFEYISSNLENRLTIEQINKIIKNVSEN